MWRLCPKLWWQKNWLLCHYYSAFLLRDFFWPKTTWLLFSTYPAHLSWPSAIFQFPELKILQFQHNWVDWGRIAGYAEHSHTTRLPGCI
jgi:hypothetical protein